MLWPANILPLPQKHYLLAVLCALAVAGTFSACERKSTKGPSAVILIVMDTARAENFSCYGYHRPTSPHVDAFAAKATLYAKAMASSPWTVPTHASIFTGKDPFEHGAHRIDSLKTNKEEFANPLHEKHITLAETFEANGFATGAFIANETYVNERYQMDQGFQAFHTKLATSDLINNMVYEWLDTLSTDRFFLFVNYMDTHTPYNAKPREGFLAEPAPHDRGTLQKQLFMIFMHPKPIRYRETLSKLQQTVIDQYDTAIANLDEQIGNLFKYLKDRELYEKSMIILTSDHGETFGEHDLVSHGKDVYQQLLWVPLIIKNSGQTKPRRTETVYSTSDIPRIILAQFPPGSIESHSHAFPNIPGKHAVIAENYFAHPAALKLRPWKRNFDRIRTVLFDWPYKYIHSSDGKHELYDLALDQQEATNLFLNSADAAKRLAASLQAYQNSRPHFTDITKQSPLTEDEIKKLKALGYMGE